MKFYTRALATSLFLCAYAGCLTAAPLNVAFLSPDPPGNAFWDNVVAFMQAVAEDLDINLEVQAGKTATGGTYMIKKNGLRLLNRSELPDYFITGYWPGATNQLIEEADKKGVGFFVFNTAISAADEALVGKPREKYPHWVGHMYPDDIHTGYLLAESLVTAAKPGPDGKVSVAGLNGNKDSAVSAKRAEGLNRYIAHSNIAKLEDIYATDWSKPATTAATDKLLANYPKIQVIWTAADSIALNAVSVIENSGRKPGSDILLGGVDWSDAGIRAVDAGILVSTVGGHFMEGGWALILIHDYHHGIDFTNDLGTTIVTKMQLIDRNNVKQYLQAFGNRNWNKIDFKQFSKVYNTDLKHYDFSLQKLMQQID